MNDTRTKRITVTQDEANAFQVMQQKAQTGAKALALLFECLGKAGEAEADIERLARDSACAGAPLGAVEYIGARDALGRYQRMLAEEIEQACNHALRMRAQVRKLLADKGVLAAKDDPAFDDVEIVVEVSNPPFSQPAPEGGAQG